MRQAALASMVGMGALLAASHGAAMAQTLTGQVTSAQQGPMEGVLVSAKREGSTITTTVVTDRTTYTINPRMFVSALVQYASASKTMSTNARFRWEYRPSSELFVVYSDGRDTTNIGFPTVVNRAFIVKLTKLFRL